ncbi:MAG: CsgG/HfaB family protein [Saprospiraceae bacterium]
MKNLHRPLTVFVLFSLFLVSNGCGSYLVQPIQQNKARLGEETQSTLDLKNLPEPKDKIVVAVYKFRDQTGQYKPTQNGTSWSTAVTQGATSILLKALDDSGWFIPIERENVSNLLNERKIIRSSRAQFNTSDASENENNQLLPPLLYAGVMLEGGIISYDANVVTGGAGLRYFGVGGSSQYRQDRVTVYLRAVSTSNGKILKTVYTSKTILSQQIDAGLFQFVRFSRLLEIETGFTYNEPSEMAVTEAIEKAVMSLVVEGILDNLWTPKEARLMAESPVKEYLKEKELIPKTDIFGKSIDNRRGAFALNIGSTNLLYQGDFPDPLLKTGIETGITLTPFPQLGVGVHFGLSSLSTKKFYQSKVSYAELDATYRFFPYDSFTPFLKGGLGVITQNRATRFDYSDEWYSKFHFGGGFEMMIKDNLGLFFSADYNYLFNDRLDAMEQGKYNDYYWRGNIGLNFYFGKKVEGQRKFQYKKPLETDF